MLLSARTERLFASLGHELGVSVRLLRLRSAPTTIRRKDANPRGIIPRVDGLDGFDGRAPDEAFAGIEKTSAGFDRLQR